MKNYVLAIATLVGTIIGVGIFTIPYIVVRSGILTLFLYMAGLGIIQYFLHLLFAEVVLSIKGNRRLPGYTEKFYGRSGKMIALLINLLSDYGAVIAYIIVGGIFLHQLLNPLFGGSLLLYTSLLFAAQIFIVLFGLRVVAHMEFIMSAIMIFLIGFISFYGWRFIDFHNYVLFNWHFALLPYGPIFFAVSGMVAIPEICQLMQNNQRKIKSVIAWSGALSVIFMTIFIFVVAGISGPATTPDTLVGLSNYFNNDLMKIVLFFGLLVIATSFITAVEAIREIYWFDFKIGKYKSWLLASIFPFVLFLLGINNITKVVSLTGSIAGGILGILIIMLVLKIKHNCEQDPPFHCRINRLGAFALSLLFIFGFIYEIWNTFFNNTL